MIVFLAKPSPADLDEAGIVGAGLKAQPPEFVRRQPRRPRPRPVRRGPRSRDGPASRPGRGPAGRGRRRVACRPPPWYTGLLGGEPVLDEDTGPFRHVVWVVNGTMLGLHQFPDTDVTTP